MMMKLRNMIFMSVLCNELETRIQCQSNWHNCTLQCWVLEAESQHQRSSSSCSGKVCIASSQARLNRCPLYFIQLWGCLPQYHPEKICGMLAGHAHSPGCHHASTEHQNCSSVGGGFGGCCCYRSGCSTTIPIVLLRILYFSMKLKRRLPPKALLFCSLYGSEVL